MFTPKKTIFISYSWKNEKIADSFCKFGDNLFDIKRDKRDINYRDSIKTFMKKIRNTDFSLLIISDDYLKSKNCMSEVWELFNVENYIKKILPIVVDDAKKIFNVYDRMEYIEYWENEYTLLKKRIEKLDLSSVGKQVEELRIIENIKNNIATFLYEINDLNAINVFNDITEDEFTTISNAISSKKSYHYHFNDISKKQPPIKNENIVNVKTTEIKNISVRYPLSQAIFACEELINAKLRDANKEKIQELKKQLSNVSVTDTGQYTGIIKKINELRPSPSRINISIDYVKMMDRNAGRTIRLSLYNQFIIVIPEQLLQEQDGQQMIKKIIAHELGHIVLHFDELSILEGTMGSNELKKDAKLEMEANIFADELLILFE